jgi:hypothetical protein
MDELYSYILARLEQVAGLNLIDIDWGQLDSVSEDLSYPVFFPCALVDVVDIPWLRSGTALQPGEATVRIKIGIQMTDDTNSGSGTQAKALARLGIVKEVHDCVNLYAAGKFSKLIRLRTQIYNVPGGVKVVQVDYTTDVVD